MTRDELLRARLRWAWECIEQHGVKAGPAYVLLAMLALDDHFGAERGYFRLSQKKLAGRLNIVDVKTVRSAQHELERLGLIWIDKEADLRGPHTIRFLFDCGRMPDA